MNKTHFTWITVLLLLILGNVLCYTFNNRLMLPTTNIMIVLLIPYTYLKKKL